MQNARKRKKRKKQLLKTILLLCLIGIMTTNCDKETMPEFDSFENQFDVQEAKDWFESKYPETNVLTSKSISTKSDGVPWRTNWKGAFTSTRGHETVVEVPLYHLGGLRLASESSQDKYTLTNNQDYLKSLFSLIIIHNRKEGTTKSYVMAIVPEASYLESKNFELESNSYHKIDHNFSGVIYYEKLSGSFVNGWKLENGDVVRSIGRKSNSVQDGTAKAKLSNKDSGSSTNSFDGPGDGCTEMGIYEYFAECVWAYNHTDEFYYPVPGSCEYVSELLTTYWYCFDTPPPPPGDTGVDPNNKDNNSDDDDNGTIAVFFFTPKNPIADIQAFLDCLNGAASAKVTVYVSEPNPGSGDTHSGTTIGHTWVSIEQGGEARTFGYYPDVDNITPFNTNSGSVLGDDGGKTYTASISKNVSGYTLASILSAATNYRGNYSLTDYNCTDFGIEIGNLAGMGLPSSEGSWLAGAQRGANPGTLGKYIHSLSSNSSRTIDKNGGRSPSSNKGC
jgi:hypothetical protein